jgi:Co/Zn/Cd efflux system component
MEVNMEIRTRFFKDIRGLDECTSANIRLLVAHSATNLVPEVAVDVADSLSKVDACQEACDLFREMDNTLVWPLSDSDKEAILRKILVEDERHFVLNQG